MVGTIVVVIVVVQLLTERAVKLQRIIKILQTIADQSKNIEFSLPDCILCHYQCQMF